MLVGTHADKEQERIVSFEQASEFAASSGMSYIETSAKTGYNVKEAFEGLAKFILQQRMKK